MDDKSLPWVIISKIDGKHNLCSKGLIAEGWQLSIYTCRFYFICIFKNSKNNNNLINGEFATVVYNTKCRKCVSFSSWHFISMTWKWTHIFNLEKLRFRNDGTYYVFHDRVTLFFVINSLTQCRITMKFIHNFF